MSKESGWQPECTHQVTERCHREVAGKGIEFAAKLFIMDDLQREKVQSEQDFNKLLNEVSSDIEKMCAKHSEEKSSLR